MKSIHDFKSVDQYKEYLRTYFAAMAMQSLASSHLTFDSVTGNPIGLHSCAVLSISMADELLKQLEDGKH